MTPDKKPFFAGTYFPKTSKYGRLGLIDLLKAVSQRWEERREDLIGLSDEIATLLQYQEKASGDTTLSKKLLDMRLNSLNETLIPDSGGFKGPKFPTPHNMLFLLRY